MKSTVDLGDLIGFYFILKSISAKGELKFLVAGLGWATAELVMTRVVPMWVGARGTEFDWKYVQLSLESNVNLVSIDTICISYRAVIDGPSVYPAVNKRAVLLLADISSKF